MRAPTRRLLSIRRCARRPLGVSLPVWRVPRGAATRACGIYILFYRRGQSHQQFVKRRPRRPLIGAGRRTTLRAPAGDSRWRRLSAVASKLLYVLRVASALHKRARRAGGCAACCFYSASRSRWRRVRLTCSGRRLPRLQRLQAVCRLHLAVGQALLQGLEAMNRWGSALAMHPIDAAVCTGPSRTRVAS